MEAWHGGGIVLVMERFTRHVLIWAGCSHSCAFVTRHDYLVLAKGHGFF